MWWGFRHYVSPAELSSFNRDHGLHLERPQRPADYIVPDLYESIISRRARAYSNCCPVEEHRGKYPDEIEQAVEARLTEQALERSRLSKLFDPDWDD